MFSRLAVILPAAFFFGGQAAADVPVPQLTARVTDLTATLSAPEKAQLESKLAAFEQKKGSQVAVLMLATTQPESIEQYAVRVFEAWKLGRAKEMDGVLLVVAKNDRRMRIEVGYGLEGALPDAYAKRIIAETMTPFFKAGNFYRGIDAGVDAIVGAIDREALPLPQHRQDASSPDVDYQMLLMIVFIGVFILSRIGASLMGRFTGSLAAGAGTGLLAWLLAGTVLAAFGIALFTFFASLLLGSSGGRYLQGGPLSGGWGGGGGFGGGGFGGGGGSSGGGGASGSW